MNFLTIDKKLFLIEYEVYFFDFLEVFVSSY
jgi:hypothetical protein